MVKCTEGCKEIGPHITKSGCAPVRMLKTVKLETERVPDIGCLRAVVAGRTTSEMKRGALRGAKMASLLIRTPNNDEQLPGTLGKSALNHPPTQYVYRGWMEEVSRASSRENLWMVTNIKPDVKVGQGSCEEVMKVCGSVCLSEFMKHLFCWSSGFC